MNSFRFTDGGRSTSGTQTISKRALESRAKWVNVHDRKYKDYPPIRNRKEVKTGESSWKWPWDPKVDVRGHREVILQTLEGYHSSKRERERWRVESEFGFLGFYEHLHEYGICDADKSGEALDSRVERYDPEGKGYYDDSQPSYPSWAPGGL
ncbi:uncharacterized protein Z519_04527 [Cladophialophora bantiana CBS 173.52]|uniref:Uncharacterized protein n=1 Tax=Cladophialophora bantiana (strain ATCC 10958 / CBS 173.52 / CDC B-1940 / NIH 8579) TaxID=1442370 RepID=A0A0D2EXD0_CLAB1|nr:uncharacterized protein Z519_04527 [Cladophialophora bantiana CBS 173.52]KIW94551.1 hypothetical protein Z519_04527 [Cladophialophora bantiana CBS 173.52]